MSNNATLVERLNGWAGTRSTSKANARTLREAAARIAELEAERDVIRKWGTGLANELAASIAERDRLKAALTEIANTAEIGRNIGPIVRLAKAALSPSPSVKP